MTVFRLRRRDLCFVLMGVGLALGSAGSAPGAALNPNEWKFQQNLEISRAGLLKVALPPSTLDAARSDLADLRLVNARGEEIPYAIHLTSRPHAMIEAPQGFRVELQPFATQIRIETGSAKPLDHVTLATPASRFVKAARLEISIDGKEWSLLADGLPLARQPGLNAVSLPLANAVAPYIRVIIDDRRTPVVPFTSAALHLAAPAADEGIAFDAEIVKREEYAQKTVLEIDTHARNLPLVSFEIITPAPLFSRLMRVTRRDLENGEPMERTVAEGQIFRTPALREQRTVAADFTSTTRDLQIEITNGDDAPLPIEKIRVTRRPVTLIFSAVEPGTYQLLTGRTQVAAPKYDLGRLTAELENIRETSVRISDPEINPRYTKPDALADTPIAGSVIDVAPWKFRKSVRAGQPGTQELELDLEVLAHAERDFRDLRLVRDERQVPYLLEHAPLHRRIVLRTEIVPDASKPRQTRWKIRLPLAGVPLQRLTLVSSTRLFERRFQVFEEVRDQRGEPYRRSLGEGDLWTRTLERNGETFSIELPAGPVGDTLYLETDNGDNPPITIDEVRADFPVVRLLFRSDQQPLTLYYGSRDAVRPRYDLELMATPLLQDEKSPAQLGEEERTDGSSDGVRTFLGQRAGILLWAALAVVVVVLLVVIARLLPKAPDGKSS
jgi:hypothetical protein